MLELERRLSVDITLERVREITKTMYRLAFRLLDSKEERSIILGMTPEQQRLVELTQTEPGVPLRKTEIIVQR